MDIRYSNVKHPSDHLPDGYSIFEYQISICEVVRWTFDIQISNIPSWSWLDGRLTFEYQMSIWEVIRWTFDIRISNIHQAAGQMDV